MSAQSKIEWTDATWNPIVGCSIVSPGCTNCYAMKQAARIERMSRGVGEKGVQRAMHYDGTTKIVNGNAVWTGKLQLAPESILLAPLRRRKPTMYFVNSMGDLFHEGAPIEWIDNVIAVMALTSWHSYQVLTKRPDRMRAYFSSDETMGRVLAVTNGWLSDYGTITLSHIKDGLSGFMLPNVWLGVSAERQQEADERIPLLLQTPAAVRFVSAEPLLGPIDLTSIRDGSNIANALCVENLIASEGLDWVIVGGESGHGARPMHPDWARSLRDQCKAAGVPFFFKQWGEWAPSIGIGEQWQFERLTVCRDGRIRERLADFPSSRITDPNMVSVLRIGKKKAGRLLDGIEHSEFPVTPSKAEAA